MYQITFQNLCRVAMAEMFLCTCFYDHWFDTRMKAVLYNVMVPLMGKVIDLRHFSLEMKARL